MARLSRTSQFVFSFLMTSIGIALSAYGGVTAIEGIQGMGEHTRLDTRGMIIFAVGAAFFSFGVMWLLVVLVRPFFEKRAVDRIVEEMTKEERLRGRR